MKKIPVAILGATGMVGQRFISLLENHPWFEVVILAASPRSEGKTYYQAVRTKWKLECAIPRYARNIKIKSVEKDLLEISKNVKLAFCALDLEKERIKSIEENYARHGVGVISNNSAHRSTSDVPMIMPEVNPDHTDLIKIQRKNRSWKGFIVVKPNCSLQSYVPIIKALENYHPLAIEVTTLQAISGASQTFKSWPDIIDNCIPYISGEEQKTEIEPLKILGKIKNKAIISTRKPTISATCIRVPVSDGHLTSVAVKFKNKPTIYQIQDAIENYKNPIKKYNLPTSPSNFMKYFSNPDRPQSKLDRDLGFGMTVSCGRFREDRVLDWKFVSLAHNTIRGAAGGAVLTAELLNAKRLI